MAAGSTGFFFCVCLSILVPEACISYQHLVLQSSVPSVGVKFKHKINDNDYILTFKE